MAAHHDKNSSILGDGNKKVVLIQPLFCPSASQSLVTGAARVCLASLWDTVLQLLALPSSSAGASGHALL